ncbi:MAG: serine/threonine-protein kinase [Hydrogeniiclostridium sp.]|mgnify:FL=1
MQLFEFPEEYVLCEVLREKPERELLLWENTRLHQKILLRCTGLENQVLYESLCEISHPNLRQIYDVRSSDTQVEVLEEYLEGTSLADVLEERQLSKREIRHIMLALCRALGALHSLSIVHRDIKPENILLGKHQEVWLIDYDAARVMDGKEKDTRALGTPGYAAPEQYGVSASENTTDIFAMGILLNMMVNGNHPAKKMCRGWAGHIVRKCTQMNPKKRYQSARLLARACLYLPG